MITKEKLKEYGMVETADESFPFEKKLNDKDNIFEFGKMSICVTTLTDPPNLCLLLGDGGFIELNNIKTIEDLNKFESYLFSYNPPI